MAAMKVVRAEGEVLEQILDESHGIWSDGLTRRAYGQLNEGQLRTAWGKRRLRRLALLSDDGTLLSSAKQYDLSVRVDGRTVEAVGIGAVFTPAAQRGKGFAPEIIGRILESARQAGAELAILFSEIGPEY